ncbi:MAG: DnaB-like helicase C-terminal domain-containing protein, partial [Clostridia bacterium]|nr:DnaB-like helicase C-terminal domain-containing protein [Clostridia bacterium]
LKILAKELDVPVIALSQLSRPAKGKENELPQLSDLRESGSIEQDADIVLMLYRNTLASQFSDDYNMAKCRIAKNRHGETGDIDFTWNGEYTRFYSAEKHRDENA